MQNQLAEFIAIMLNREMSMERLRGSRFQELKKRLAYAFIETAYYRDLFNEHRFHPDDIKSPEDITKIPLSERSWLADADKSSLLPPEYSKKPIAELRTSGSSGKPVTAYLSKDDIRRRGYYYMRYYFSAGYLPGYKILTLMHRKPCIEKSILKKLGLFNEIYVSPLESVERLKEQYLSVKPRLLRGLPSMLLLLADIVREEGLPLYPTIIMTTGERLSDKARNYIEQTFKTRLYDYYSSSETGLIAHECREHKGYHVVSDSILLESVLEDGSPAAPGESGAAVLTCLKPAVMPIIRYKPGDQIVLSDRKCSCKSKTPLVEKIIGRSHEYLNCVNGNKISLYVIEEIIESIKEISAFQLAQTEPGAALLKLQLSGSLPESGLSFLNDKLKERIPELLIKIRIVDSLQRTPSGKIKVFANEKI